MANFSAYLRDSGDTTNNAIGDYSLAEEIFSYTCTDSYDKIARMIVTVRDAGVFDAENYGAGAALTNGIRTRVNRNGIYTYLDGDLTDGIPIKSNAEWGSLCFDADVKTWGTGDNFLLVRWTFTKAGNPLILGNGDKLEVVLNDDFSFLVSHFFCIQGLK